MSFEPFHLIFFLIWGFFLYKALFRRRKRPPVNMPPDIPHEEKSAPPSAADTDGEYDYQALRKKILTTWGKQEEGKELDLPDEMEKPVYHEKPLPKPPLSATIKKKKVTEAQDLSMQERARLEQMQAYVREKPVPVKEKCEHREGTLPAEEKSMPSAREWTEKDAREWVRYDAIFGSPRSRSPWQPIGRR